MEQSNQDEIAIPENPPPQQATTVAADDTTPKVTVPQQTTVTTKSESQESITTKVVSLLDVNKISDWKSTLSGSLDDQRLFWALFVLGIFYIFYILVNTTHNDENKDEDSINKLCECNPDHRYFYIILFCLCSLLWIFLHFSLVVVAVYNYFKCNYSVSNRSKESCPSNKEQAEDNHQHEDKCPWLFCYCCRKALYKIYDKFKFYILDNKKLSRYEFHLWTQYCELYAIGITKNTENFNLDNVETIIRETLINKENTNQDQPSEVNDKITYDATTVLPKYYKVCDLRVKVQGSFFIFIKLIQLTTQLFVVPMLIIQMYDTYAFLCFAADSYCTTRDEYNLHLDQTAFTFGFYAALMISLLTTRMLQWNPWPQNVIQVNDKP